VTVKNEEKYSNLLSRKDEKLLLLIAPKHNQTIKMESDIFRQKFVHLVHGDEASPFNINNVTLYVKIKFIQEKYKNIITRDSNNN
jgi:hypothetical protein